WGLDGGAFYLTANTSRIKEGRGTLRLMMIVRVPFADRDEMTDTAISKSQLYTITGEFLTLAIPAASAASLKVLIDRPTPINYYLAEIPFLFSPSQVSSLSDVQKLGGKILGHVQTTSNFVVAPSPTNPQAVCPPVLVQPARPEKS